MSAERKTERGERDVRGRPPALARGTCFPSPHSSSLKAGHQAPMAPLFPPAATAPIRTLTLVRSSSASSSAGAGAAQQTHLPISSLPLVQGKRVVSRDAPHAPQGVRVGSSSSLLFNLPSAELDEEGGKSGSEKAEREKEEVEVRGSPWAKLVLCESPLLFSKHQQPLSFSLSLSLIAKQTNQPPFTSRSARCSQQCGTAISILFRR